jgi:hypothetical protein
MSRDDAPNLKEIESLSCATCVHCAWDDEDFWVCRNFMFNIPNGVRGIATHVCDDWSDE